MEIVIITRPDFFEGETALVNRLFELGMPRLHLRKPKATAYETAEWIEQIAQPFRRRIVLHDHHQLAPRYNLGGIHLNARNPVASLSPRGAGGGHISRSCHSIEELQQYQSQCDYLFLSPIFDSISKEGYGSAFSREAIATAYQQGIINHKVYALGGISSRNLSQVRAMGFGGAAILGDLWQAESPEEKWLQLYAKHV